MAHPDEDRLSGSSLAAIVAATAAFAALAVAWWGGDGGGFDVPWAPAWGLRLNFELDGLAALYALLAAGVGAVVFTYASAYVPLHLAHQRRPRWQEWRLHAAMVTFLVAMVGLATAQDLILLFVFWDLTAVASYLLIAFDRDSLDARLSALMAFLVTAVSAVPLLIGFLLLRDEYGTSQIPEILARLEPGGTTTLAGVLIAVGALAKSAQVPLHFWLPRAMAAPTPVSAYLHSAAMVAAGVFLLSRVHPVLATSQGLLDALLVIGLLSMAVGGVLALQADRLKQVLAYSTISQYGYVVALLGIGGSAGAAGACFYVLAHGLAKSALFLTAGTVTEATGAVRLSEAGGWLRRMPVVAGAAGITAAGIAGLPLTIGFFKDELFFKATVERGTLVAVLAVAGAALTFAYMARFWGGIFLGRAATAPMRPVPARMVVPIVVLAALVLAGGIVVEPFADLAAAAAAVTNGGPAPVDVAYHLDSRTENLMALGAWAGGAVLLALAGGVLRTPLAAFQRLGERAGPERIYRLTLHGLNVLSDRMHDIEVRDLRTRIIAVVLPSALLITAGLIFTPTGAGAYHAGDITSGDTALVVTLAVTAVAGVLVCRPRRHLALALMLSAVGFALAVVYALIGAPDVALVAVLIETLFALLFFGVYALVPRDVLRREAELRTPAFRRVRDIAVAAFSGAVVMLVVWGAFSRPVPENGMAERHEALVDEAHGQDVVTVILTDFRGLDTLVEMTVIAVAVIGVALTLRRRLRP